MSVSLPQVDRLQGKSAATSPLQKASSTRSAVPDFADPASTPTSGGSSFAAQLKRFLDPSRDTVPAKTDSSKIAKRRTSRDNTDPTATGTEMAVAIPISLPVSSLPAGPVGPVVLNAAAGTARPRGTSDAFAGLTPGQQRPTQAGFPITTPGSISGQTPGDQAALADGAVMPAPQSAGTLLNTAAATDLQSTQGVPPASAAVPPFSESLLSHPSGTDAQQTQATMNQNGANSLVSPDAALASGNSKDLENRGDPSAQTPGSANLPAGAETTGNSAALPSADDSLRTAQNVLAASAVSMAPAPAISRLNPRSQESPRHSAASADSGSVKEAFQNALKTSLGEVPAAAAKMEQTSAQRAVAINTFNAQRAQSQHAKSQAPVSEAGTTASTAGKSVSPVGPGSDRSRQANPASGSGSANKAEIAKTLMPTANSSDAESAPEAVRAFSDGQPGAPSTTPANASSQSPVTGNPAAQERGLAAWDNMDAQAGRIVNSASLAAQPDHVEMRMDVRTEGLGALEIHAVLDRGRLGATINAESPEARAMLASHLPAFEQSLSDRNVHMEHIVISNHLAGSESTLGAGSDSQGRGNQGAPGKHGNNPWSTGKISGLPEQSESEPWDSEEPWRTLSVRA